MINKRLLIKNLLAHNDESSFYDKKLRLDLSNKEGKAKFIKHVCALSNSNPFNNSYILVGIRDEDNAILGVDFFDDSKIQNLVNAYLQHAPKIQYENISFPRLPKYKVVGLVTIHAKQEQELATLRKNVWKYYGGTVFYRRGSTSMISDFGFQANLANKKIVAAIEKNASNNIELTLNGVFDFMERHHPKYQAQYKVFKEQFVLCWAGKQKQTEEGVFYSRVDIELVNEQIRLFYSDLDAVQIAYDRDSFRITEYIQLGIHQEYTYYPFEKTVLHFKDNGLYKIATEYLFEVPKFADKEINHLFTTYNILFKKLQQNEHLQAEELEMLHSAPVVYLMCILANIPNANSILLKWKEPLKRRLDKTGYIKYKEVLRLLRKMKHNTDK